MSARRAMKLRVGARVRFAGNRVTYPDRGHTLAPGDVLTVVEVHAPEAPIRGLRTPDGEPDAGRDGYAVAEHADGGRYCVWPDGIGERWIVVAK